MLDIGPKKSLALTSTSELKNHNWIDIYTRALFVEVISFNGNTQLFSHLRFVFEQTGYSGWYIQPIVWSANLYPYAELRDYVILAAQVIFIVFIIIQIILFFVHAIRQGKQCCFTLQTWITLFEILVAVTGIVCFILRITYTIQAVEDIFNADESKYRHLKIINVY